MTPDVNISFLPNFAILKAQPAFDTGPDVPKPNIINSMI